MRAPRQEVWPDRLRRAGLLLAAILLHAIVFSLVATQVIWKAPPPPVDDFHGFIVPPPPPPLPRVPTQPAAHNVLEPQAVVVPIDTPANSTTTSNGAFPVDTSKILDQSMNHLTLPDAHDSDAPAPVVNPPVTHTGFGSPTGSDGDLSGYLYDLQETRDGKPAEMPSDKWREILTQYIAQDWDESVLQPYYRSPTPLYSGVFAIAAGPSSDAPKAFGLTSDTQPLWVIHYHAKVTAFADGDYRFVGFGDAVLEVKINGTLVLDGGRIPLSTQQNLHQTLPNVWSTAPDDNTLLKIGPAFHIDIADPVDLDVLIGNSGATCSYYLLIEKVGTKYEKLPDGTPLLPFFQIGNAPTPGFKDGEEHPPYSSAPEPWQAPPEKDTP